MRTKSRRRILGCALLAVAACGFPSSAEFAGGAVIVPAEGGLEAGATEASTNLPDGAPTSTSTSSGGDTGAPAFVCPATATFCDDFEGASGFAKWDAPDIVGAASAVKGVGLDGGGLVASTPNRTDAARTNADLSHTLPLGPRAPLTISADLKVAATTGVGIIDIDFLRYYSPFYRTGIRIAGYAPYFMVRDYGDPFTGNPGAGDENGMSEPVPTNTWFHVSLSYTFSGTQMNVKASIDGNVVYTGSLDGYPYADQAPVVIAGIAATEDTGGAETVSVDNFVVTSP